MAKSADFLVATDKNRASSHQIAFANSAKGTSNT